MALDKFKSNLQLKSVILNTWNSEYRRIRDELLENFTSFLKAEDFSIIKNQFSATAKYQTATLTLEVPKLEKDNLGFFDGRFVIFHAYLKYNKWGEKIHLSMAIYVMNQDTTAIFGNHNNFVSCFDEYKNEAQKYLDNFKPFQYEIRGVMQNDQSKLGFLDKIDFVTQDSKNTDRKTFKGIEPLVEAVLNNDFSLKNLTR